MWAPRVITRGIGRSPGEMTSEPFSTRRFPRRSTVLTNFSQRVVRSRTYGGFVFACQPVGARINPVFNGEVAEWSNAAVLKTVERESVPGVRIPVSPPPMLVSCSHTQMLMNSRAIPVGCAMDFRTETQQNKPIQGNLQGGLCRLVWSVPFWADFPVNREFTGNLQGILCVLG